jgi:hypothetical protein|tara:strand:- start:675 stop:809 length:135 start_codon:yes stop_codon:yes gene_type:complete
VLVKVLQRDIRVIVLDYFPKRLSGLNTGNGTSLAQSNTMPEACA